MWEKMLTPHVLCGPVCVVSLQVMTDEQRVVRFRPLEDYCESAETRASQLKYAKAVNHGRQYLRGEAFEFATSLLNLFFLFASTVCVS